MTFLSSAPALLAIGITLSVTTKRIAYTFVFNSSVQRCGLYRCARPIRVVNTS